VTLPDTSILAAATRLAREELAPRAADYDRDARNPVDKPSVVAARTASFGRTRVP
jgi:hypothetical protein